MLPATAVAVALWTLVPGAAAERADDVDINLQALPTDQLAPSTPTIDRLEHGDVITVRVTNGVASARGLVRQCRLTVDGFLGCVNTFPVQFGDAGDATFQYQLDDPGGCDGTNPCVIAVSDVGRERSAYAFTVFGTSAPPAPDVDISPPGPYEPGAEVRVRVSALRPGTIVKTAFCEPACGPTTSEAADDTGTVVSSVPVPSAGYDTPRLVVGLAFAAVLLLVAWRIVTSVDWRPPSEAQTPELDVSVTD